MSAPIHDTVMVADRHPACQVLGPGTRYAIWVQGCPLSCTGCVSPQWIPFTGGIPMPAEELAAEIIERAVDGLTLSGGEPFSQAPALVQLVRAVRRARDLSVLSYTGYSLERLRQRGTSDQQALLDELDLLIDGPYSQRRHAALRWRGSRNQRIHVLTERHRDEIEEPDDSAGVQIEVTSEGLLHWIGVPPSPGFRHEMETVLQLATSPLERGGSNE